MSVTEEATIIGATLHAGDEGNGLLYNGKNKIDALGAVCDLDQSGMVRCEHGAAGVKSEKSCRYRLDCDCRLAVFSE